MNVPTITCILTRVPGNPLATFAKCGLDREIELLNAFKEQGFQPQVNSDIKPKYSTLKSYKNCIFYLWMDTETNKRRLVALFGIPSESLMEDFDIAAVQRYTLDIIPQDRMTIANHIIEKMMGNKPKQTKTAKIKWLYEQGCFDGPSVMTCSVSHSAASKTIYPDTKPDPEKFEIVNGLVVAKQ